MKRAAIILALIGWAVSGVAQDTEGLVVTGKVIRNVESDEMVLNTSVTARAATVSEAFKQGNERSSRVIEYLKSLDDVCEVQTEYLRLNEVYTYQGGERKLNGFQAVQNISLRIRDFDMYEEIMSKLIDLGVDGISNLRFTSTKAIEMREAVRLEAIAEARRKAEVIAEALGVAVGPVEYFEEIGYRPMDIMQSNVAYEMVDGIRSGGPVVSPGKAAIEVEVRVRFAILAPQE